MGVGPIQSRAYITKAYPSSPFPYSLILYVYDACDAVSAQGSGTRKKEKKKGKRAAGQWLKDGLLHSCHFISFHFTGLDLQLFFFSFFSFREENSQRFAIRIAFYLSFFFFPFFANSLTAEAEPRIRDESKHAAVPLDCCSQARSAAASPVAQQWQWQWQSRRCSTRARLANAR